HHMTVYLTFNDSPSGVYASQVIDVVNYLSAEQKQPVKLVAFVSIRNFRASRHKIKRLCPNAIVLPMIPGAKNGKMNRITLKTIFGIVRPKTVVARGIFATHLAFRVRKVRKPFKLVFDARGAYHAEFSEYRLIEDDHFIEEVRVLEKQALHRSDAQLAVSNALVEYWQSNYGFSAPNVRVIPCTLAGSHSTGLLTEDERTH